MIEVRELSKRYHLGAIGATSLRNEFNRILDRLKGSARPSSQEFWALRNVSFEVQRGEVIGIIGRNGAGKSTLLKILSRITDPTTGSAVLRGRIASLLEVGTGFHPELTGRENIYLNGAILGMSRAEVTRKLDEIIAFAEVDKFVDTPVKRYSSGMYVRLAFAVAAHLEPEILIVDEVLAVGDAKFQKKCLGKIQDTATQHGRTVLFVSHNMPVISTICQRVCWLADGQVRQIGPTEAVIAEYLRDGERTHGEVAFDVTDTRAATVDVRLLAARVVHRGRPTNTVPMNEDFGIEIEIEMLKTLRRGVTVSFHMYDNRGALVLCAGPSRSDPATVGRHKYLCQFPANLLNSVGYTLSLFVVFDATEIVIQIPDALAFEAVESKRAAEYMGHVGGAIRPTLRWQSEHES